METRWQIRPLNSGDHDWVEQFMVDHWGSAEMVAHGESILPANLPGFVCFDGDQTLGLVTYRIAGENCEMVSLNSLREQEGIGSTLLETVVAESWLQNCQRVWLITTNDNLQALNFYQKRGFHIVKVIRGAVNLSRRQKPTIPLIGMNGIPITDEIELTRPISS